LPEGKYVINKTIYVLQATRIIGYGTNRPSIVLKKNSSDFQQPDAADKSKMKYMFWFIRSVNIRPCRNNLFLLSMLK
jgi:hypothetical protein